MQRIDIQLDPPCAFVTAPVQLAVMRSTQRHREFVADLLCQSARLRKTQVVVSGFYADGRVQDLPPSADTSLARVAMIQSDQAVANFVASFLPDALTEPGDGRLRGHYKTGITSGIAAGAAEIQLNLIASEYLELPRGP